NWELRVNQSKPKLKHVPECQRLTGLKNRSWREWSRWQSSDIDEARTVSAGASEWSQREAVRHRRSKAEVADREVGSSSQSIEAQAHVHSKRVSDAQITEIVPGWNGADGSRAT